MVFCQKVALYSVRHVTYVTYGDDFLHRRISQPHSSMPHPLSPGQSGPQGQSRGTGLKTRPYKSRAGQIT